jgi:hypothetical protein
MATAQTIIDRALRLIGALESGESASGNEATDALTALNAMISSWQNERLYVYAMVDTALTLTISDASYTVGPSANFNVSPRPTKIEDIYVRDADIDYPVQLVDFERWDAIPDKSVTSDLPDTAYYNPTYTTGTLQLWPVPSKAVSLHIVTWSTLAEFASAGTSVSLPQGYERALAYGLAVELAPEYGKEASQTVLRTASEAIANIKRANNPTMTAYTELGMMMSGGKSDIVSGGMIA